MQNAAFNSSLDRRNRPMLALPASNADVLVQAIEPALALLPDAMTSDAARVMLLAIGRQESGFATRTQISGPARGFPQFEMGGVMGVMRHPASAEHCKDLCAERDVGYAPSLIYKALANDDVFAMGMARLLLWTDPRPLPALGDMQGAWNLYERCWRPGKPSYPRWHQDAYPAALQTLETP
jgi:hypothetical protein